MGLTGFTGFSAFIRPTGLIGLLGTGFVGRFGLVGLNAFRGSRVQGFRVPGSRQLRPFPEAYGRGPKRKRTDSWPLGNLD